MDLAITVLDIFKLSLSNEKLMTNYALNKHRKVLEKLYLNCGDDLYHFLLTLSDRAMAEDIAQQTWIKVIESSHLYKPSGQFKSWLFTIARRLLIDEIRRISKYKQDDHAEAVTEETSTHIDDTLNLFNDVLNKLPFEQREAYCLQQEGFSLKDIEIITGAGAETIKSRLRYARKTLTERLKKYLSEGESE